MYKSLKDNIKTKTEIRKFFSYECILLLQQGQRESRLYHSKTSTNSLPTCLRDQTTTPLRSTTKTTGSRRLVTPTPANSVVKVDIIL